MTRSLLPAAADRRSRAIDGLRFMVACALLATVVGCARYYPGDRLVRLPADAAVAVSVGPRGSESKFPRFDRSLGFVADAQGRLLGRVEGKRVDGTYLLGSATARQLIVVTRDAVTVLDESSRLRQEIDEPTVALAVNNPQTGQAAVWFNTGFVDDVYSTHYVISGSSGLRQGYLAGLPEIGTFCGDRLVVIVRELVFDAGAVDASRMTLYEMSADAEPVARARWTYPASFRPISSRSACSADGKSVVALYTARESEYRPSYLVRVDTADGSRVDTTLDSAGIPPYARGAATATHGERLYWVAGDGTVLSVRADGSETTISREWMVPDVAESGQSSWAVSVAGDVLTVVNSAGDEPAFTKYELTTGKVLAGPVALPWLRDIVGSVTESGSTVYQLQSVTSLQD